MDWQSIGTGLAFLFGTVGLTYAVYFAMRVLTRNASDHDTRDLAGSVIFRVASLHGLILALVFAQELVGYQELRTAMTEEATAVADIYNDIRRYGADAETEVQAALSRYTRLVIEEEWEQLAETARLYGPAWGEREIIYQAILNLNPQSPREEALRNHMLQRVQMIAERRQQRENNALETVNPLFWFAALAGVVLVTLPYFTFAPSPINLALLSVYGAFSGIVMFVIYAFSDPFSAPGALRPLAFEALMRTEIGAGP